MGNDVPGPQAAATKKAAQEGGRQLAGVEMDGIQPGSKIARLNPADDFLAHGFALIRVHRRDVRLLIAQARRRGNRGGNRNNLLTGKGIQRIKVALYETVLVREEREPRWRGAPWHFAPVYSVADWSDAI